MKNWAKTLKMVIFALVFFVSALSISYAYDIDPHYKFSGVKSPESPYKNTWGAFQTDLFSGSFSYDYKIAVPPGAKRLQPKISISYNSHSAKGKAGWVGSGWGIPLSYIQRDINYTRSNVSDDKFELYLEGAKHNLVEVSSAVFHTKIETYLKIEQRWGAPNLHGAYWVVTTKDGTEYRFGYNADSENVINATDPALTNAYVWRWSLDRIKDSIGNCIYFTYAENPNPSDKGAVYLSKIEYNNEKKRVIDFILEPSDKPDMYLTIEQGSEVREARRLAEVRISVNGAIARKYKFAYSMNEIQTKSLLSSITQYGADGVSALPPVKFDYTLLNGGFNEATPWDTPGTGRMDIRTVDSANNDTTGDTFDANGDGLPDIVRVQTTQAVHDNWKIWLNTGNGFAQNDIVWSIPKGWSIRNSDVTKSDQAPHTKTTPMDYNGDGYVDFLRADGGGDNQLKIVNNYGNGFSEATCPWNAPCIQTMPIDAYIRDVLNPYTGTNPNVTQTFIDINGDGLPDIIQKKDNTHWQIRRNTGNGFVDYGTWQVYHTDGWIEDFTTGDPTNMQTGIYDVNGDGLLDIVDAHSSVWKVYLNTGSNFLGAQTWDTHNTSFSNINDTDSKGRVKRDFIDINGDGLPDIVNPVNGVTNWQVWYNTGNGFSTQQTWSVPADVDKNGYIQNFDDAGDCDRNVFDIDGDGVVDLIRESSGYWNVYTNKAGQADLLSKVTDTLGGTISTSYTSSMNFTNTRLPHNYWLVSTMTTNNGMSGAHANTSTTKYFYAIGFYDFPSKEFRGFGQVTETRADGSIVNHYYRQDETRKGKEYQTETTGLDPNTGDPSALYAGTYNTWDCQQFYPSSQTCATTGDLSKIVYTSNLTQTDNYTYDGDGTVSNRKTSTKQYQNYDAYGNIGLQIDLGDASISGDEVYTYSEFLTNCASGINDRIGHTYVTAVLNGSKLREKYLSYDGVSACPTKGNLTKEEHWLNTAGNPVTTYEYDPLYGNRTKTTDPEGRISQTFYDTIYNTFPEKSCNTLDQCTTTYFNAVNGQPTQVIDPNGFTTRFMYDTFYRKEKEIKPYDSEASPTVLYQYDIDGTAPEQVKVFKRETAGGGTLDTVQVIDGFGNLLQTKTESENPSNMIAVDVFYDEMGRVKKQSNPYNYSTPDTSVPSLQYTYDALGRPVLITNPDGTQISRIFDHWTVTETDENGHSKNYWFDAFQRLKQVVENIVEESYTTNYQYSPLGELKQIKDHNRNLTTIEYDTLGRKTKMVDPDMGTWIYGYDKVGNLVKQTDARGITTNIQYDPLNRKILIDYPNDTDVQFTYDRETKGTLSQVTDSTGIVTYLYDQRLRKTQETRALDSLSWTTSLIYDSMDRVTSMTYPDGQLVTFNYNAQGNLDNIPGVVSNIDYNASGQMTQKNYANGKTVAYTYYDFNQRLKTLSSGLLLQAYLYVYDNVGNITGVRDYTGGGTENFTYDDLDRLITAGDSGYSKYSVQYQYNAIGNMLSMTKDDKNYSYSYGLNAGPHAVTEMKRPLPNVGSFILDNGNYSTTTNKVTLNNISMGNPTNYMASEDKLFADASWLSYATSPSFILSGGFGTKTVYFKVKNADGESNVKYDTIEFRLDPKDIYKDQDGDGLSNFIEYILGTDATQVDTDGDGLTDYVESFSKKTNPKKLDTDNDGLNDSIDPYPNTIYHNGSNGIYTVDGLMNEGGDVRDSPSYRIRDSIGNVFVRNVMQVESHPAISAMPDLVDFKALRIGESYKINIVVSNTGIGSLIINALSFAGENASEFTKQNDNCSGKTLAHFGSCLLDIVFTPSILGPKNANLSISSNAPATPVLSLRLIGAGVQGNILFVNKSGMGNGLISDTKSDINCGNDCSEIYYDQNTEVTLTAATEVDSIFTGWTGGGCTGTGLCKVIMNTDITVTASFSNDKDKDGDGYTSDIDCDDDNPKVYPGAVEICDDKDNNCNGQIDEGVVKNTYYRDSDGDNYGDPNDLTTACTQPAGYVINNSDCEDNNAAIKPGATEICDKADNNCDGKIDEGIPQKGDCTDFSVDINSIYYKDNVGREINCDFSFAVMDQNSTVVIPQDCVLSVPPEESGTTFLWELPLIEDQYVEINDGIYQMGIPQATNSDKEGFSALGALNAAASPPTEWEFTARISKFRNVTQNLRFYEVEVGSGNSKTDNLAAKAGAVWFTGNYQGTNYNKALFIWAKVSDDKNPGYKWDWKGTAINGYDPANTVLDIKDAITNNGKIFSAFYRINSDNETDWQLAVTHTVPEGVGTIYGFNEVYPFISLYTGIPSDLTVISVSNPPVSKKRGRSFNIKAKIKNSGNGAADNEFTLGYYLSKNKDKRINKEVDILLAGDVVMSSLVAGASSKAAIQLTIPIDTPIGKYYVKVCADNRNDLPESNEDNNCRTSQAKIKVKP